MYIQLTLPTSTRSTPSVLLRLDDTTRSDYCPWSSDVHLPSIPIFTVSASSPTVFHIPWS
jgi:hypothetical protein